MAILPYFGGRRRNGYDRLGRANLSGKAHGLPTCLAKLFSPEVFFAIFLTAGFYKADARFALIQSHFDLTVLFLLLSVLGFVWQVLRTGLAYKLPRSFQKVVVLYLALAFCVVAGLLYTPSRVYAFDKALRFLFITGWAYFGGMLLVRNFQSLKRFTWALVVIAAIMSLDAALRGQSVKALGFLTAFGSNYIALARMSSIGLLAMMGLLIPIEKGRLIKVGMWLLTAFLVWSLLDAGARGPVVFFFMTLVVYFWASIRGFSRPMLERSAAALGRIILVGSVVLVLAVERGFFGTLLYRFKLLLDEVGDSVLQRIDYYMSAINLWARSPLFGIGTGGFGVAYQSLDVRTYPHNIILEIGVENGILGVMAFVFMLGMAFGPQFIKLLTSRGPERIIRRYLTALSCFMLLNTFVSGDINDNRMLFTFLALMLVSGRFYTSACL